MDAGQFDRLAKALQAGTDRRTLMTGLGASVLAILFGVEESAAKRKHHPAKAQHHQHHRGHPMTEQRQVADENHHRNQKPGKQPVTASAETCLPAGHRCKGKQATRCCDGLVCGARTGGSARRCRRCAEGTVFHNGACCTPDNTAACAGRDCGDVTNNCKQTVSCGGACSPPPPCTPQCSATNPCGNDGCDGSCGQCAANETCQSGSCICAPDCTGKVCGGDGCGGSCGGCDAKETCRSGNCLCLPDCGTKVCGGDGCGGSCGSCLDQGAATCGTTGACHGGDCDRYASGTQCQAATCMGETMLKPACTCDGEGGCDCPGAITCPTGKECRNGACLTSCRNND